MEANDTTTTDGEHGSGTQEAAPFEGDLRSEPLPQDRLVEWVRENQTLAVTGAFAVGVLIGALMRR